MQFLETRSEVKFKFTVTQLCYVTLLHSQMHPLSKFEIPTWNNIKDMLQHHYSKTRSEVKVTVIRKWYEALHHLMMHPHNKFGIPTSKNLIDMLWAQSFLKLGQRSRSRSRWPKNGTWHSVIPRYICIPNLEFLSQRIQEICTRLNAVSRN